MKRMLIVTPDPESAEILRLAFELKDFSVTHALSSSVAVDHFRAHDPHIVIFDVLGMKTEELRKAEEFINDTKDNPRPTLVLTPRVPNPQSFPILASGHVLKKPYDLTTLVKMVVTLVSGDR
jgi:DNA-binding response OmpR family regulator